MRLLPHEFQSISERQWRAGKNRHRCAACSCDYSNLVHLILLWPLVISIEDCYVPQSAAILIPAIQSLDDESCAVMIKLWAMDADPGGLECDN
jgi:hypothetical protein